jgi:predicted dehydrogenase
VDVPGCLSIRKTGEKATRNGRCLLVDFQTRTSPLFKEAVNRVHQGAIGRIVCGEATYQTGRLGVQSEPGSPEARLKNWVFDIALSGDIIVEQNIHALDVACWIADGDPVRAVGTGGRKARTDVGDCFDPFSVIYTFPDDVIVTFSSKQLGQGYDDIICRMYGSDGTIDTHYSRDVTIRGKRPYEGGKVGSLYTDGAVANIADFHDRIQKGDFSNPTVAPSVRSNLTTVLGRIAAYHRREVTWDEMMKVGKKTDPRLVGLKD